MTLGGRVSKEIFFGTENIATGAQDDLQKIIRMAFEACANYSLSTIIGPVSYDGREGARESWTKLFYHLVRHFLFIYFTFIYDGRTVRT